jgi:hypothetical protein
MGFMPWRTPGGGWGIKYTMKFANGGEAKAAAKEMSNKLFGGKETYSEELKEAKALKSGKISEKGFAAGERSEGHKGEENPEKMARRIKSGKMSPKAYAKMESKEPMGMKGGGYVRSADGIAKRGKTKGTMVTMRKGGICK